MSKNALIVGRSGALDVIDATLQGMDYEVTLASSGQQAIDLIEQLQWGDLLYLVMDQADSFEVLQRARRRFPECVTILVADSSRDSHLVSGKMLECADAVLFIPAEPDRIKWVIEVAIARAAERQRSVPVPST